MKAGEGSNVKSLASRWENQGEEKQSAQKQVKVGRLNVGNFEGQIPLGKPAPVQKKTVPTITTNNDGEKEVVKSEQPVVPAPKPEPVVQSRTWSEWSSQVANAMVEAFELWKGLSPVEASAAESTTNTPPPPPAPLYIPQPGNWRERKASEKVSTSEETSTEAKNKAPIRPPENDARHSKDLMSELTDRFAKKQN